VTDGDGFIREVTEDLRRDRMLGLWRRWAPVVAAVVVGVVGTSAFLAWRDHARESAAREAGGLLLAATEAADPAARAAALASLPGTGAAGALARLHEAAARAEAGEAEAAAALYQQVAEGGAAGPALSAFAAFRAVTLRAEALGPAATAAALGPLTVEGGPFRPLALEARAAALRLSGDAEGARADLTAALAEPGATQALRARAAAALELLGPAPAASDS
jgi:hypothetical protein